MKLKYLIYLFLITFSCDNKDGTLFIIDPRSIVKNQITLADIGDEITYIPLDNKIPFTNFKYVITTTSIYVSAKGIGILKFDREGRLINRIGSQGRGPGEFIYGMEFAVDERSGNVYILDPHKIKVYSANGIFLRDIPYDSYISSHAMAGGIEFYNSLLFLPDYIMEGNSKYNWIFLDTLGNLVSIKNNSVPEFYANVVKPGCIYKYDNKLFYFNYFNDTIFSISPDLQCKGEYLFAQGPHRWPRANINTNSFDQFSAQISRLFLPYDMFETEHFIVLRYAYLKNEAISFINKKTKKTFIASKNNKSNEDNEFSEAYLENDLDGGIPLKYLNYYNDKGEEYLTEIITPFDLKVYISSDEFKNSIPKYSEMKKDLKKFVASLKETDNPVLILIKLKE